jgi:DNA-binding response OmpR family regulator
MKLLEREPPHILFADDDPATLDIYAAYIKSIGWTADYVKTARDLIEQVNHNCNAGGRCYDALVCDVNFFDEDPGAGPRITGVTAAKVIRENHPDLPIVFVTAYSSYLVRDVITDLGGELFSKPVDFEQLFARVAYLIRWNRIVRTPAVQQDRRTEPINHSGYYRRKTDSALTIPPVLEHLITEVREHKVLMRNAAKDRTEH